MYEEHIAPEEWVDDGEYMRAYGVSKSGERICVAVVNKKAAEKLLRLLRETKHETPDRKDQGGPEGHG